MTNNTLRTLLASAALAASACASAADYTAPGQLSPPESSMQKAGDAAGRAARDAEKAARKAADAARAAAEKSKLTTEGSGPGGSIPRRAESARGATRPRKGHRVAGKA